MDFQTTQIYPGVKELDPIPPKLSRSFHSGISADRIRNIRKAFEDENQYLEKALGPVEHNTLMVTMYETTEHFLNKPINDFDVVEYLESLKMTAEELHNQGLTRDEFRNELIRQSQDTVVELLKKV